MSSIPDGMDPAMAAQFAQLQRNFVAGLSNRLHTIAQAKDVAARELALHSLAGAAGAYGYATLSGLARKALAQASVPHTGEYQEALSRLAQEIQTLCTT